MTGERSEPLVSVIIPCYNGERYLKETLDSVFAQTFQDYEVIVVEDGSTDHTVDIIQSYGSRVRVEPGPRQRLGPGPARTAGTRVARGEFLQCVDQDDLLFPDAIERRVAALQATGGDVAYSDWQKLQQMPDGGFSPTDERTRTIEQANPDAQLAVLNSFWAPQVALLYRRRSIERISWRSGLVGDCYVQFNLCLAGARFVHVPGISAYYRVHGEGISRNRSCFYRDVFDRACYMEQTWKRKRALSLERRVGLAAYYADIAGFAKSRDRRLFRAASAKMLCLRPRTAVFLLLLTCLDVQRAERLSRMLGCLG